jgi:hypothetical protein
MFELQYDFTTVMYKIKNWRNETRDTRAVLWNRTQLKGGLIIMEKRKSINYCVAPGPLSDKTYGVLRNWQCRNKSPHPTSEGTPQLNMHKQGS